MVRTSPLWIYLLFLTLQIYWVSQRNERHWSPLLEQRDQTLKDLMNRTAQERTWFKETMSSFASGMWYALMWTDLSKNFINYVRVQKQVYVLANLINIPYHTMLNTPQPSSLYAFFLNTFTPLAWILSTT